MSELENLSTKLIAAAFAEAELRGWRGLNIPMLARKAGLTMAEAYRVAPDMETLLDVYAARIDAAVAQELAREQPAGEWRESVFDALMMRCDAMLKDREALRVIAIDESRSLIGLPRAGARARRSMQRMLEAAGLGDDPLATRALALALVPLYARILKVWFADAPDQAKTMAALDKGLRRMERWRARAGALWSRFGRRAEPDGETDIEIEANGEPAGAESVAEVPAAETKH